MRPRSVEIRSYYCKESLLLGPVLSHRWPDRNGIIVLGVIFIRAPNPLTLILTDTPLELVVSLRQKHFLPTPRLVPLASQVKICFYPARGTSERSDPSGSCEPRI